MSERSRRRAGGYLATPSGDVQLAAFLPLRYWIRIFAVAITTAGVVVLLAEGSSSGPPPARRLAFLAIISAVGIACVCAFVILRQRNVLDREMFGYLLSVPALGAVAGLLAGFIEGGVLPTLLAVIVFVGFGGVVSAAVALFAGMIAGVFYWFDMREQRARTRQGPHRM